MWRGQALSSYFPLLRLGLFLENNQHQSVDKYLLIECYVDSTGRDLSRGGFRQELLSQTVWLLPLTSSVTRGKLLSLSVP